MPLTLVQIVLSCGKGQENQKWSFDVPSRAAAPQALCQRLYP